MTCFDEEPDGDIHGECAAEIHRLQSQVEQLQAENARLLEALVAISGPDSNHPAFIARPSEGKRLDEVYEDIAGEALAFTDSSNWLAEQKAQWRREVLVELGNEAESNGNFVLAHQLKERANSMAASQKVEPDKLVNPAGPY